MRVAAWRIERVAGPRVPREAAGVAWRRDVPDAIRSHATLDRVDYADVVTAAAGMPAGMSPERWAHSVFAGGPRAVRLAVPFAQRRVLGLRLAPYSSAEHPLGWSVDGHGDGWVRLQAGSWMATAQLVGVIEPGRVSVATFIRYDRRLAGLVWAPVSLLHRRVAITLMRRAAVAAAGAA